MWSRPRVPLGRWPTPLQDAGIARPGLWIKRDDLSGWGRGGAKARKLESLLGHLRARRCTDLMVVTGNVTNLVFDILPALDTCGIRSRVLVLNHPGALPLDREAIFAGVRDRVQLLGASGAAAMARALAWWSRARGAGRRPFLLLPGAAHPASVIGNACGMIELAGQLTERDVAGATVYVSVATGTTLAGFLLGSHAVAAAGGPRLRVIGVALDRAPLRIFTLALIRWTERFLGVGRLVPADHVTVVMPEGRPAFAAFAPDIERTCERVQSELGLNIDPIFGGKTWHVMERHLGATARRDQWATVYWHCGFTPEWRALGSVLRIDRRQS